jgi:uncharacterized protein (TIGR02001 family)
LRLRKVWALFAFLACALPTSNAQAQVAAAVSVFSDDLYRGYSLSDNRPVAILDLSYDAPSGLYASLSGSVVASRHHGPQPLGAQAGLGYAKRLKSGLTVDLGAIHSEFSEYSSTEPRRSYSEAYLGLAGKYLSSRLFISPDYLKAGQWSLYGEVNGKVPVGTRTRFTAHAGMLVPLRGGSYYGNYRREIDWRFGAARDVGPVTLHVDLAGVVNRDDLYRERRYGQRRLVLGASWAL